MKAAQVCIIAVLLAGSQIAFARQSESEPPSFDGLVSLFAPRSHTRGQGLNETEALAAGNAIIPNDTTQPPANFTCTSAGQFPDPRDCKAYHVCIYSPADGNFQDNVIKCPTPLIYCGVNCVFENYGGCKCNSG